MFDFLSRLFKIVSEFYIQKNNQSIYTYEDRFSSLPDAGLKDLCKNFYHNKEYEPAKEGTGSIRDSILALFSKLLHFFSPRSSLDNKTVEQVALAIEVFNRSPADLPVGSKLFPEQISAALSLTQRCLVQMNTGEGKTYAILPAAFSLACRYGQIYIVCANSYLALRDAKRTSNFWEFTGMSVGLCVESDVHNTDWNCQVIYTTLDALLFTHLENESATRSPRYPIKPGAVILDEADAILLDNGSQHFAIVLHIQSETYDWSFATSFVTTLQRNIHVKEDAEYLSASLTIEGEKFLKDALLKKFNSTENYLIYREAVEKAYIGIFLTKEGVHFISRGNRLHPVNLVTGQIAYNQDRDWIFPLEFLRGFPTRIEKITYHTLSIDNFFKLFSHMSGTSGSIMDDLTEYFFSYLLFTVIIPPRKPRYKGEFQDMVYKTKKEAKKGLIDAIISEIKKFRPVLVGVQSINDAEAIYDMLRQNDEFMSNCKNIRLITGKNEESIAEVFEGAGVEQVVTIATQLAGRGVDIRLSARAHKQGGLALFCLEHSQTMRHDKQFLGRAGRHGDPFTSAFYVSLEDELFQLFGGGTIAKLMESMSYKEGEVIQHKMITQSIKRAQNKIRKNNFIYRRGGSMIEQAEKEVYDSFTTWNNNLKLKTDSRETLSEYFFRWLIHKYVLENLEVVIPDKKQFTYVDCQPIVARIREDIDVEINTIDLEGRNAKGVADQIRKKIDELLFIRINEHNEKRENLNRQRKKLYQISKDAETYLKDLAIYYNSATNIINDIENLNKAINQASGDSLLEPVYNEKILNNTIENVVETNSGVAEDNEVFRLSSEDIEYLRDVCNNIKIDLEEEWLFFDSKIATNTSLTIYDYEKFKDAIHKIYSEITEIKNNADTSCRDIVNEYSIYNNRPPIDIAHWSIFNKWIEYLKENTKDKRRLSLASRGNQLDYSRKVCDELIMDWERAESQLALLTLRNLLKSNQPQTLKALFFYDDNSSADYMTDEDSVEKKYLAMWEKEKKKNNNFLVEQDHQPNISNYVNQFLNTCKEATTKEYSFADVEHTLNRFINFCPVNTLRTPDKIQQAIEIWEKEEIKISIVRKRRSFNKKWLLAFLSYLSSQKIIAVLPSFRTKLKSRVQRLIKNISDPKTLLTILQPIIFLIIFSAISVLHNWLPHKHLLGWQTYIDYLLFGGFISTGILTAACFFITILGNATRHNYLNLFLMVACTIFFICWQVNWTRHESLLATIKNSLLSFIIIFLIYRTNVVSRVTKMSTGISLVSGWFCFCILFIFFPRVFGYQSIQLLSLLIAAFVYFYWRSKVNYSELTLLSSLTNFTGIQKTEEIRSCVKVEGSVGYMPHLYSMIGSLSVFILVDMDFIRTGLGLNFEIIRRFILIATYIVILYLMTKAILKTRLSVMLWKTELNKKRAILVGENTTLPISELDLPQELQNRYKKFIFHEFLFQLALVLFCFFMFNQPLPQTGIPAFIIFPFIYFLLAENLYDFSNQLYKIFISRAPSSFDQVDFSNIGYEESPKYFWEKFNSVKFLKKFFIYLFSILTLLKFLFELNEKFIQVINYLKHFFS